MMRLPSLATSTSTRWVLFTPHCRVQFFSVLFSLDSSQTCFPSVFLTTPPVAIAALQANQLRVGANRCKPPPHYTTVPLHAINHHNPTNNWPKQVPSPVDCCFAFQVSLCQGSSMESSYSAAENRRPAKEESFSALQSATLSPASATVSMLHTSIQTDNRFFIRLLNGRRYYKETKSQSTTRRLLHISTFSPRDPPSQPIDQGSPGEPLPLLGDRCCFVPSLLWTYK